MTPAMTVWVVTLLDPEESPKRAVTVTNVCSTKQLAEEAICQFIIADAEETAKDNEDLTFYEALTMILEGEEDEPHYFTDIHELNIDEPRQPPTTQPEIQFHPGLYVHDKPNDPNDFDNALGQGRR